MAKRGIIRCALFFLVLLLDAASCVIADRTDGRGISVQTKAPDQVARGKGVLRDRLRVRSTQQGGYFEVAPQEEAEANFPSSTKTTGGPRMLRMRGSGRDWIIDDAKSTISEDWLIMDEKDEREEGAAHWGRQLLSSLTPSPTASPTDSPRVPPRTPQPTIPAPTVQPTPSPTMQEISTPAPTVRGPPPMTPEPTPSPTAGPCVLTCPDGEFVTPDCTCSGDPCDACPDGSDCVRIRNEEPSCILCECGFCLPAIPPDADEQTSCCDYNGQNNCKSPGLGSDTCNYNSGQWPGFIENSGNICGGVEMTDTATDNGCGCKPSSDTPCTFDPDAVDDLCFVCTSADLFFGECDECKECAINDCGLACADSATDVDEMTACFAGASSAQATCLSGCNCIKD